MRNFEIHNFRSKPVCDGHFHPHERNVLEDTIAYYKKAVEYFGLEKIAIQCLPSYSTVNNYEGLYLKTVFPNAFVNAGLLHNFDDRDTPEYYEEQAKALYKMGCDGFKMLEGKPDYRKEFGRPLDHPSLDKFYSFVEEKELPLVLHYGDPREFWDIEKIPKWALERGWLYDKSFVHFDEGQKEVERVLEKHPKLHLILAHFFFVSDDYEYAVNLMEKWENVCLDITPGTEMFFNFDKDKRWREFFIKYSHRIVYGTDTYNWKPDGRDYEDQYGHAVNLIRAFLEKSEPFFDAWTRHEFEHPFNLPDEVLDNIYCNNFVRLYGKKPRAINPVLLKESCKSVRRYGIDETARDNLETIINSL